MERSTTAATAAGRVTSPTASGSDAHSIANTVVVDGQQNTGLQKQISNRQFVFMAMGGSIGAGLLFASSLPLALGGPGSLLLGFLIVGVSVTLTMGSLGELGSTFPVAGSFYDYSVQFISPSWGFAMGWNYIINFVLVVPLEVTVIMMVIKMWSNNTVPMAALIPVVIVALLILAACGAKWYAEAEHAFGILKVLMLVTFSLVAIVILAGGTQSMNYKEIGFVNWEEGRAFKLNGAGILLALIMAGMAYGGTEMLGLTVGECQHPQKVMPLAFKIVTVRIIVCYLLPLFFLGLVIGPSDFMLATTASPFVIALKLARIPVLPGIFNGIILISIFSMASACVFASSRALRAICAKGMGPRILSRTTKSGLPLNALGVVFAVSLIAFLGLLPNGGKIFHWLVSLASASNYFTWLSINIAQIRLRLAIKKQGLNVDDVLVWKSPAGILGSIFATIVSIIGILSLLIVPAIMPANGDKSEPLWLVEIRCMLGTLVVLLSWLGHLAYTWKKSPHPLLIPLEAVDLSKENDMIPDSKEEVIMN